MSNTRTSTTSSGVGILELLTVAFVILKLCHVIDWSWWWVLAPTWIPLALVLAVALVYFVLKAIKVLHFRLWAKRIQRKYGSGR